MKQARLVGGLATMIGGSLVSIPTGFITAALLSRIFGPALYGTFTVCVVIVNLSEMALAQMFSRAIMRFGSETGASDATMAWLARLHWRVSLLGAIGLVLAAPLLARLLGDPLLGLLLPLYALDLPFWAQGNSAISVLMVREQYNGRALVQALYWLGRMVFVAGLALLGWGLPGAVLGVILASLLQMIAASLLLRPPLPPAAQQVRLPSLRRLLAATFFFSILFSLFTRLDLMVVKALAPDPDDAGYYAAAQNLMILFSIINGALGPLLLSQLSRLGQSDEARRMVGAVLWLLAAALPGVAVMAGAAHELMPLIYGADFAPGAPVLAWVMGASLGLSLMMLSSQMLAARNRPEWALWTLLPLLPLALFGYLRIVPEYGGAGAAALTAFLTISAGTASLAATLYFWRVRPPLTAAAVALLLALGGYLLASTWPTPGWGVVLKLGIAGLCGLAILGWGWATMRR